MAQELAKGVFFLTFLIYPDEDGGEGFVAHCLEMDIVATGATVEAAIALLKELIEDVLKASLEDGTIAQLMKPAPREYWQRLAEAKLYSPPRAVKKRHIQAKSVHRVDYALV